MQCTWWNMTRGYASYCEPALSLQTLLARVNLQILNRITTVVVVVLHQNQSLARENFRMLKDNCCGGHGGYCGGHGGYQGGRGHAWYGGGYGGRYQPYYHQYQEYQPHYHHHHISTGHHIITNINLNLCMINIIIMIFYYT